MPQPCAAGDLPCQLDSLLADSLDYFGGKLYVQIETDGQVLYTASYGGLDSTSARPLASASKWLTGATVMAMVDSGYIALDDSIGAYLPQFTARGKGAPTLRQLLSFTSGFAGDSPQDYEKSTSLTMAQAVDSIAANMPLTYSPGGAYHYGSSHMHIAAQMCRVAYEDATGQSLSWDALFKRFIAEPVGMPGAFFGFIGLMGPTDNSLPAGGANCAPYEYMRFLRMLLRGGLAEDGTRVLSQAAVDEILAVQTGLAVIAYTPYPTPPPSNEYGNAQIRYGLGCFPDLIAPIGPFGTVEAASSPGAFGTHPWINRADSTVGIVFTFDAFESQSRQSSPTALRLRQLVREHNNLP